MLAIFRETLPRHGRELGPDTPFEAWVVLDAIPVAARPNLAHRWSATPMRTASRRSVQMHIVPSFRRKANGLRATANQENSTGHLDANSGDPLHLPIVWFS